MDLASEFHVAKIIAVVVWAAIGIAITYGGYRILDMLDPMDYQAEITKGNVAAAIKVAAFLLVIGAITIAAMVS
jgi:uncharacterized membrane protein YjfL (UPF0719 family)